MTVKIELEDEQAELLCTLIDGIPTMEMKSRFQWSEQQAWSVNAIMDLLSPPSSGNADLK
jgi:hypothetical protein